MGAEDAVAGGLVGGFVGGSLGYKAGYEAGYKKKEQEDMYVMRALQIQLRTANQTVESLKRENEKLRNEKASILDRLKKGFFH